MCPTFLLRKVLVGVAGLILFAPLSSRAATSLPGTDIRSWATADISSRLSFAGQWSAIDPGSLASSNPGIIPPFWNVVRLGASQREGVVMGSWVFNGSSASTLPDVTPVRAVVFAQQADGTLLEATAAHLGNSLTNGAGAVLVADFNGDGFDDVVMTAHNESPFYWKASTAWISKPDGTLSKITLPDAVMNHDAKVVLLDGKKKIVGVSFGGSGNNGNGPGFTPVYTWNGTNFSVETTSLAQIGGMSILAGPFTGNSDNWIVVGDSRSGLGVPFQPTNPMLIYAYKYNNGVLSAPPFVLPKPYFNDKPEFAGYKSYWDPHSKTHTSRLWTTDLNQDGLPDILAGQEIWTADSAGLQKAVFQIMINKGNMVFEDQTDTLGAEFSQDSNIDYSVRFADVDGSGIDTIFHSVGPEFAPEKDELKFGQYILVNDGTGRLYAAMHPEFRAMRTQIRTFLASKLPAGVGVPPNDVTPQFIAYRTASGSINFLAMLKTYDPSRFSTYGFVNVPLGIDLATDFRRNLTIATRNGSRRIRTFAGDDTISRAVADPDCAIDGGLGTNTVVYPGKRSDWIAWRTGAQVKIRPAVAAGGTDTLTRIQSATFADRTVDLAQLGAGVTLQVNVVGQGSVVSSLAGISGEKGGSATYESGSVVTLTATPGAGYVFSGWSGGGVSGTGSASVTLNSAQTITATFAAIPPTLASQPAAQTIAVGRSVTFVASATGAAPLSFQWRKDGVPISGATSASYTITSAQAADAGSYSVVVTNAGGSVTSSAGALTVTFSRLINLSINTQVTAKEPVITMGMVVGGAGTAGSKPLLIRAGGPSLVQYGVANALPDPRLRLFTGSVVTDSNDNWGGTAALGNVFAQVGAFPFVAPSSKDAALFNAAMPAGAYTVEVSGAGEPAGQVIAELYDASPSASFLSSTPRLVNASVRKIIAGGEILTAGFFVAGNVSKQILIRAVGPGLAQYGVTGTMPDPRIELFDGAGKVVDANDNWGGSAALAAAFSRVAAFALPPTSLDAALLVTLPPGSYTAQVSGGGGVGGDTLVEVYEMPD